MFTAAQLFLCNVVYLYLSEIAHAHKLTSFVISRRTQHWPAIGGGGGGGGISLMNPSFHLHCHQLEPHTDKSNR